MKIRTILPLCLIAAMLCLAAGCTRALPPGTTLTASQTPLQTTVPTTIPTTTEPDRNPSAGIPDEFLDASVASSEKNTLFYKPVVGFEELHTVGAPVHRTVHLDDPEKTAFPDFTFVGLDDSRHLYLHRQAYYPMGNNAAPEVRPVELGRLDMESGEYRTLRVYEQNNARVLTNNNEYIVWAEYTGGSLGGYGYAIYVYTLDGGRLESFELPIAEGSDAGVLELYAGYLLHHGHLYYEVVEEVSGINIKQKSLYDYDIRSGSNRRMAPNGHSPFVADGEIAWFVRNPETGSQEAFTASGRAITALTQDRFGGRPFHYAFTGDFIAKVYKFEESGTSIPESFSGYKDETGLLGAGLSLLRDGGEVPLLSAWVNSSVYNLHANRHVVLFTVTDLDGNFLYDVAGDRIVRFDTSGIRGIPALTDRGIAFRSIHETDAGQVVEAVFIDMGWTD